MAGAHERCRKSYGPIQGPTCPESCGMASLAARNWQRQATALKRRGRDPSERRSGSLPLARVGVAADAPVLGIERINPLTSRFEWKVVEDGREGVDLFAVNDQTTGHTEWTIHSKDLARRAGNHLGLEPAVLSAFARVKLPDQICCHSPKIADENVDEGRVADRATHRRANSNAISAVAGRHHQACPIVDPVALLGHTEGNVRGWSLASPVPCRYLVETRGAARPH